MLLFIDGDTIVYKAAGAAQHKNKELGVTEYEPEHHAFQNAKRILVNILEKTKCNDYRLFLTESNDKTCFRTALFSEYKANRKRLNRPKHYKAVREYLINQWGAEVVATIEADDAVSICQWEANKEQFTNESIKISCIAGVDKDLEQIPGYHYNYNKDEFFWITPLEGLKSFYKQILGGDVADNVPRIQKGWRSKKAFDKIDKAKDEMEIVNIVIQEYEAIYGKEDFIKQEIIDKGQILYLKHNAHDCFKLPNNEVCTNE